MYIQKQEGQFIQKCTHRLAIQDADEFVSLSEQIWRNSALQHMLTSGSSAVGGCRQNVMKTSQ